MSDAPGLPTAPAPRRNPRPRTSTWLVLVAALTVAAVCTWWLDARLRPSWVITGSWRPIDSFVGRTPPDFVLTDVRTGQPVRLADSLGRRPVFLLFGSFSCPRLVGELPAIRRLYEAHGREADFRLVYSKEAYHRNPPFEESCQSHPEVEQRGRVQAGLAFYHLDFPCAVADAEVEGAYAPFPARVLVFDRAGEVVFDSTPASAEAGLRLPEAAHRLEECLATE